MIENFNSASSFYKNKTWNPLFAIAQQGQSWQVHEDPSIHSRKRSTTG